MADLAPPTRHLDNEVYDDGEHKGRWLLPVDPSKGGCVTRHLAPPRSDMHEFTLKDGAITSEEMRAYAADLTKATERAMLGFEGDRKIDRHGKTLFAEFALEIMPGDPVTAWELAFAQWNAAPGPGETRYRSPPASLGMKSINGIEHLTFGVSQLLAPVGDDRQGEYVQAAQHYAVKRRRYQVRLELLDGRGRNGEFRGWVDGLLVCNYRGRLGYQNFSSPYFGIGIYRHNNATETMRIRVENLREGIVA